MAQMESFVPEWHLVCRLSKPAFFERRHGFLAESYDIGCWCKEVDPEYYWIRPFPLQTQNIALMVTENE